MFKLIKKLFKKSSVSEIDKWREKVISVSPSYYPKVLYAMSVVELKKEYRRKIRERRK